MLDHLDDTSLIQLVLQGNQPAYSVLVQRYESYVFTLVLRFVPVREQAEEVAQDVFVKAYRCLADFKGNCKFSTWLYTIVNTTSLSHLRRKKDEAILLDGEKMLAVADGRQAPSDRLEQKTQKQLIQQALKRLPETDASVLQLFYLAEQSLEEIGLVTGMTPGNVKVRLFRARQKLREVMETEFSREMIR
jgi:RNA polymerase sigma factor (sigma-70 family)